MDDLNCNNVGILRVSVLRSFHIVSGWKENKTFRTNITYRKVNRNWYCFYSCNYLVLHLPTWKQVKQITGSFVSDYFVHKN